jgi:hypothetical protein
MLLHTTPHYSTDIERGACYLPLVKLCFRDGKNVGDETMALNGLAPIVKNNEILVVGPYVVSICKGHTVIGKHAF